MRTSSHTFFACACCAAVYSSAWAHTPAVVPGKQEALPTCVLGPPFRARAAFFRSATLTVRLHPRAQRQRRLDDAVDLVLRR